MSSSWSEERRRNNAADAEQRRLDKDAAADRALKLRDAEDKRRREERQADKAERRAEEQQKRKDRTARRKDRAAAWARLTEPANAYGRGTTALVTASVLASLPAQIKHFVAISPMMLPIPFALEGAAWVAAAGVRYADEKGLPGWVRWMLRILTMAAAGYAAHINYAYGAGIAPAAAWGLAGVTLGGPLYFEIRQWVMAMSTATRSGAGRKDAKARRKHDRKRRRHHKAVADIAGRLISAAPYGTLLPEEAWTRAWAIVHGTQTPGMTAALEQRASASRVALAKVVSGPETTPESAAIDRFLEDVFGTGSDDDGNPGGTPAGGAQSGPHGSGGGNRQAPSGDRSEGRFSLGRKRKQGSGRTAPKTPEKPLAPADLAKVRALAVALGGASNLSHSAVKKAVGGGSNDYLVALRKAVQAEAAN